MAQKFERKCYNIGKDNPMFGRKHTKQSLRLMRLVKLGENNPVWRGDEVGYCALHAWVKRRKLKPVLCEICRIKPPYDLASIDDKYTRNLDDWQWLCRKCHMATDNRGLNRKRDKNGRFSSLQKV